MSQSFTYPSLMYPSVIVPTNSKTNVETSSLDVTVLQDNEEDGYNNAGLEIYNEFVGVANKELINRELVNLENANVNIDNSSDVIIGPVTQFNVNGNVTIYPGKDGQTVGIDKNTEIPNGSYKDQSSRPQKEEQDVSFSTKRKYTFKFYLGAMLLLILLTGITLMLFFVLRKDTQQQVYESPKDTINIGDHQLIPKEIWNGKIVSDMTPMNLPADLVIVKHTAGGTCDDFESCAKKMRSLQSNDISINKLKDVYFNFAVGGDGNVYVGRDWNVQPASGKDNIDLVMIGNFALDPFTPAMINATKAFLEFGLDRNMLTKNYKLINHNQTSSTMSPGLNVIVEVRKWPHYDGRNYLGKQLPISTPATTQIT